jgi:hypothetical protein
MWGYSAAGLATAALDTARKAAAAQPISLAANLPMAAIVPVLQAAGKELFSRSSVVFTKTITRIVSLLV